MRKPVVLDRRDTLQRLDHRNIADYKQTLGQFCTGVTIVTSLYQGEPVGFTCQSFSALSIDPPMILISPDKKSSTWPKIRDNRRFAINVLSSTQEGLSRQFGRSGEDKFAAINWDYSPGGLPIFDETLAWLECQIYEEIDAGDHTLVLAKIEGLAANPEDKAPLLFHRGQYVETLRSEAKVA